LRRTEKQAQEDQQGLRDVAAMQDKLHDGARQGPGHQQAELHIPAAGKPRVAKLAVNCRKATMWLTVENRRANQR